MSAAAAMRLADGGGSPTGNPSSPYRDREIQARDRGRQPDLALAPGSGPLTSREL